MNKESKQFITAWIANLDVQIGDTAEEINKRRQQNENAVRIRDDLKTLIDYMETTEIPDAVYRTINYCLNWNPFVHPKSDSDK